MGVPEPVHNLLQKLWPESGVRCARYGCAALVALGVLAIFFCPIPSGPFQATHGPTSALRASRAALSVFLAMALAGLLLPVLLASMLLALSLAFLGFEGSSEMWETPGDPVSAPCALRC